MMMRWGGLALVGLVVGVAWTPAARARDLVVLSAAAARQAVRDVPAQFRAATGDGVRFVFGTAGAMRDQALSGRPFDLVIVPPAVLADLVKRGVVLAGSRLDLGTVRLAAAVRDGAAVPDIGTEAALKAALLAAPSVGLADPATGATSGIYLAELMRRMGIADAVRAKARLFPDGSAAMAAVARGEVALGLGQKSEITPVAGAHLAGELPEAVQLKTIYAAGLAQRDAADPAARDLQRFLATPGVQAAFRANGFDPP